MSSVTAVNSINELPAEKLTEIFAWLSPRDALRASRVCRHWCSVINTKDENVWKVIYRRHFGDKIPQFFTDLKWKERVVSKERETGWANPRPVEASFDKNVVNMYWDQDICLVQYPPNLHHKNEPAFMHVIDPKTKKVGESINIRSSQGYYSILRNGDEFAFQFEIKMMLYNWKTRTPRLTIDRRHDAGPWAFHGKYIFLTYTNKLEIRDKEDLRPLQSKQFSEPIKYLAVNDKYVVAGFENNRVSIIDIETGQDLSAPFADVLQCPDDYRLKGLSLVDVQVEKGSERVTETKLVLDFGKNKTHGMTRIIDIQTGKFTDIDHGYVQKNAKIIQGSLLIKADTMGKIIIWDLNTGLQTQTYQTDIPVIFLSFYQNTLLAVSKLREGTRKLYFWDTLKKIPVNTVNLTGEDDKTFKYSKIWCRDRKIVLQKKVKPRDCAGDLVTLDFTKSKSRLVAGCILQ